MRERISMKSKMLGALALFTLIGALFVMQSAASSPPTADAATGTIHALNVGTCLTTDLATFEDEDCDLAGPGTNVDWEVREEVEEVSTLYATYAYDPKTASDEPRVIMQDADLIKISISDSGRDKRTGVLIAGKGNIDPDEAAALAVIQGLLDEDESVKAYEVREEAELISRDHASDDAKVENSGNLVLNFDGSSPFKPMDIDGTIKFFGCVTDQERCEITPVDGNGVTVETSDELTEISSALPIDEDGSQGSAGDNGNVAPWVAVNASVPATYDIYIYAIYYETSDKEILDGGQVFSLCSSGELESTDNDDEVVPATNPVTPINTEWKCVTKDSQGVVTASAAATTESDPTDVVFTEDEIEDNDALTVRAKSDGDMQSVDLYLQETGRFSGQYVGFVRLTDANGDGKESGR